MAKKETQININILKDIISEVAKTNSGIHSVDDISLQQDTDKITIKVSVTLKKKIYDIANLILEFVNMINKNIRSVCDAETVYTEVNIIGEEK